jgi:PAS domain S-box-containing protein
MAATKIQRIKSSDAIKAEQLKNKILIDNAFGGIYTLRGRRFEMVNRVFKEITGYTERELTATQFDMQTLIASIESEGIEAMASREMGDSARKSYQLVIRTKQNEVKRLAINTVILEDEKGPYTLGVALDITPLLSSEKKLKEANEELSSRNEELKHFAHMASHNLRAPVSNMLGLLAIYDANENESTHNQTVITSLNTTVNELNRTLEDMHYVLKMRATDENNFEEINLNEVYSMCCNVLKDQIDGSGIEIKLHFEVPTIKYIRYHLDNIFINMLSNAIKYRKLGSTPHLTVSSTAQDGDIELCFQDNGIGIDLNKYGNELFGMYKRFTQQSTGRGIGLYLVHSQVHAMGGTITVESEIASGTLFKIRLNPGL